MQRIINFNTEYRTSDVVQNLGKYFSGAQRIVQWKDVEVILAVKMETRHPFEGHLEVNFRRSVIIAEL